jgi:hypothetical protein
MSLPREFFTPESMLTLAGASGSTFVVCNSLQKAFDFNPRWLALAVAQIIVLAGTASSGANSVSDYLVGTVNGFLVYLTAAGGAAAASDGRAGDAAREAVGGAAFKDEEVPEEGPIEGDGSIPTGGDRPPVLAALRLLRRFSISKRAASAARTPPGRRGFFTSWF